ncbi:hypothetical protein Tco_0503287 [Tanacetum coccineum]
MATNYSTTTTPNNISLQDFLQKERLEGLNFVDWRRKLRIVLSQESKLHILQEPLPMAPATNTTKEKMDTFETRIQEHDEVSCIMLMTMSPELRKQFENFIAYDMITVLEDMFQQPARQDLYECTKALVSCRMQESGNLSGHVLGMKILMDRIEWLGFPIRREFATDIILQSLPPSFGEFIADYHRRNLSKSIMQLHGMLLTVESNMAKSKTFTSSSVLTIKEVITKNKKPISTLWGKCKSKVGESKLNSKPYYNVERPTPEVPLGSKDAQS